MTRLLPWLLPLLLAAAWVEAGAHLAIRARVPSDADHAAAADHVRAHMAPDDAVGAAPAYLDPIVRQRLGDRIGLRGAGRSDLAAYGGLWAITLHGALPPDAPADVAPDQRAEFGPLTVLHWPLPKPNVLFDFTAELSSAKVSMTRHGKQRTCPLRRGQAARGGGLGKGAIAPPTHFACQPPAEKRPHGFVGAVVVEDLSLSPRHCVWQHPSGREPLRVRFEDVPLGERLVLYGGLYYEHERMREGAPVDLRVLVDGRPLGRMHHVDGEGWRRVEFATGGGAAGGAGGDARGEVVFEVTTDNPRRRGFCWSASTRSGG